MLDRAIFVKGGDTHEHVTVNQQPNDAADAARLYGETYEKAKKEVREIVAHMANNVINFMSYEVNLGMATMTTEYYVAFTLNGQPHNIRVSVEDYEMVKAGDHLSILENVIIPAMSRALLVEVVRKQGARALFPRETGKL